MTELPGRPIHHVASKLGGKYVMCVLADYSGKAENTVVFPWPVMEKAHDPHFPGLIELEEFLIKTWDDFAKTDLGMGLDAFKAHCRRFDRRLAKLV